VIQKSGGILKIDGKARTETEKVIQHSHNRFLQIEETNSEMKRATVIEDSYILPHNDISQIDDRSVSSETFCSSQIVSSSQIDNSV
jgi:hypothetical protein